MKLTDVLAMLDTLPRDAAATIRTQGEKEVVLTVSVIRRADQRESLKCSYTLLREEIEAAATNNEDALQHRLWMVAKRVSGAVG